MAPSKVSPKFSIIIPTFNSESVIEETLCSALRQTYVDFEVVVDDNASSDGTRDIVQKWQSDTRLVLNANEEGLNIPDGWNRAVESSRGEYFILLHHDNLLHPQFLETVADVIERLKAEVIYTECSYFKEATPKDIFTGYSELDAPVSLLAPGPRAVSYVFRNQRMVPTSCTVIARRCLEGRPAFYPRYLFDPDMEQLTSLVETFGVAHIERSLCAIRTHEGQAPSWRKPGFSEQYFELMELQHVRGRTEGFHFRHHWTEANQDISRSLAQNAEGALCFFRFQMRWLACILGLWSFHTVHFLRKSKLWFSNWMMWMNRRRNLRKVKRGEAVSALVQTPVKTMAEESTTNPQVASS